MLDPTMEVRLLANETFEPGFNRGILPGRWQTWRDGKVLRKVLETAGWVLNQDRGALTAGLHKMRATSADQARERKINETLDAAAEYLRMHLMLIEEAQRRLAIAAARLKLVEIDCPEAD